MTRDTTTRRWQIPMLSADKEKDFMAHFSRRAALRLALASTAAMTFAAGRASAQDNPMPDELRQLLERDPNAPILGNPQGNITLVEFFDYNCPYCRSVTPDLHRLILDDPQLRVVFREWPVFGDDSTEAAKLSLAALKQQKYWQLHSAMMGIKGKANAASTLDAARKLGLDIVKLQADAEAREVQEHIFQSMDLADHMALVGTPTFIAGNEALFGKQSLAELKGLVARARSALL